MSDAYFVNCLTGDIAVNLNTSMSNTQLVKATQGSDTLTFPFAKFPVAPSPAKAKFGSSGDNRIMIIFGWSDNASIYSATIGEALARDDLYFYIYDDSLVGKNERGYGTGITISTYVSETRKIQ